MAKTHEQKQAERAERRKLKQDQWRARNITHNPMTAEQLAKLPRVKETHE